MTEKKETEEIQDVIIKKEIQGTITPVSNEKATEEEFFTVLKIIAPGTNLRTALDGALKTEKGALIVVENEHLTPLIDGGFKINCRFTPQKLVELTKMDGAIVLSKDMKKINFANVLLTPDSKIKTLETGTRHRAAERTAKQTGTLVIAISERKHEISLFYKNIKHPIKNIDVLIRKASEHIQLLEKQRELFDNSIDKLTLLEIKINPSLNQAVHTIQKGRLIEKIAEELKKQIVELGNEGTILKTRLKEILLGVEKETNLVIRDYTKLDVKKSNILLETLSFDEILDSENILKVLAYEESSKEAVKGWRILSKTSLSEAEIAKLIKETGTIEKAISSDIEFYSQVLGENAAVFKQEIDKIKLDVD